MAKYGIATVFENSDVGYEFTPNNIPLHLTHVDSFQIDLSIEELAHKLAAVLSEVEKFDVRATKDTFYGPNKDIPVTELELTPDLANLHAVIMKMLADGGAVLKNPEFHASGFMPHVSIYGLRRVNVGDVVSIRNVSIASKVEDTNDANTRILTTIPLKAS
jgi:hypothetical protein